MKQQKPLKDFLVLAAGVAAVAFELYMVAPWLPSASAAEFSSSFKATSSEGSLLLDMRFEASDVEFINMSDGSDALAAAAAASYSLLNDLDGELLERIEKRDVSGINGVIQLENGLLDEVEWWGAPGVSGGYVYVEWDEDEPDLFSFSGRTGSFDSLSSWDIDMESRETVGVPVPVPEPSFILGFITLASLMLGSRKKKEAKKT
jgi:hypothetical protein